MAAYRRLLSIRVSDPAFHPYGAQQVLFLDDGVFALVRISPDGGSRVLCLHNVSDQERTVQLCPDELGLRCGTWSDLPTGEVHAAGSDGLALALSPYQVCWLKT